MAPLSSRKFNYNYSIEFFGSALQTVGGWLVISIVAINKVHSDLEQQGRQRVSYVNFVQTVLYSRKVCAVNFHIRSASFKIYKCQGLWVDEGIRIICDLVAL